MELSLPRTPGSDRDVGSSIGNTRSISMVSKPFVFEVFRGEGPSRNSTGEPDKILLPT